MTTDVIELNNFIVLIEQSYAEKAFIQRCSIDRDVVGFAFYGSGDVELEIRHNGKTCIETSTTGMAISFFSNSNVEFSHKISPASPLQSISIFTKIRNLETETEGLIFAEHLNHLVYPQSDFVKGPCLFMTPVMQQAVRKILQTPYQGNTRLMFLQSQVNELLAHFFALISEQQKDLTRDREKEKLLLARDILTENIAKPPSLKELSKLIGLNSTKLKKNFRELFGIPVFKYLQEERLNKAYELLSHGEMTVQEAAWYIGYESLSSFSNAFRKKFGARPTEIRKQFFSNKS